MIAKETEIPKIIAKKPAKFTKAFGCEVESVSEGNT
jgi:hypothetical protein